MSQYNGQIVILKQPGGTEYPIKWQTKSLTIGSDESCDGCIFSDLIDAKHCVISLHNNRQAFITHVGGNNFKTFVEGMEITKSHLLLHNTKFSIGKINFRFEYPTNSKWYFESREESPAKPVKPRNAVHLYASTPKNPTYSVHCHKTDSPTISPISTSKTKIKTVYSKKRLNVRPFLTPIQNKMAKKSTRKSSLYYLKTDENRRHVSFGPNLSPEQFDKELPPIQPLKKGATPLKTRKEFTDSFVDSEGLPNSGYKTRQSFKRKFSIIDNSIDLSTHSKVQKKQSNGESGLALRGRRVSKNLRFSSKLYGSPINYSNSSLDKRVSRKKSLDFYDYSVENEKLIEEDVVSKQSDVEEYSFANDNNLLIESEGDYKPQPKKIREDSVEKSFKSSPISLTTSQDVPDSGRMSRISGSKKRFSLKTPELEGLNKMFETPNVDINDINVVRNSSRSGKLKKKRRQSSIVEGLSTLFKEEEEPEFDDLGKSIDKRKSSILEESPKFSGRKSLRSRNRHTLSLAENLSKSRKSSKANNGRKSMGYRKSITNRYSISKPMENEIVMGDDSMSEDEDLKDSHLFNSVSKKLINDSQSEEVQQDDSQISINEKTPKSGRKSRKSLFVINDNGSFNDKETRKSMNHRKSVINRTFSDISGVNELFNVSETDKEMTEETSIQESINTRKSSRYKKLSQSMDNSDLFTGTESEEVVTENSIENSQDRNKSSNSTENIEIFENRDNNDISWKSLSTIGKSLNKRSKSQGIDFSRKKTMDLEKNKSRKTMDMQRTISTRKSGIGNIQDESLIPTAGNRSRSSDGAKVKSRRSSKSVKINNDNEDIYALDVFNNKQPLIGMESINLSKSSNKDNSSLFENVDSEDLKDQSPDEEESSLQQIDEDNTMRHSLEDGSSEHANNYELSDEDFFINRKFESYRQSSLSRQSQRKSEVIDENRDISESNNEDENHIKSRKLLSNRKSMRGRKSFNSTRQSITSKSSNNQSEEDDNEIKALGKTRKSSTSTSMMKDDINDLSNEIEAEVKDKKQPLDNRKSVRFQIENDLSIDNKMEPNYSIRKSSRGSSINSKKSITMNESKILEGRKSSVRKSVDVSENIDVDNENELEEMPEENMEIEKSMNKELPQIISDNEIGDEKNIVDNMDTRKSFGGRKSSLISRKSNKLLDNTESEEVMIKNVKTRNSTTVGRLSSLSRKSFGMREDNDLFTSESEDPKARKSITSRKSSQILRKSINIKDNDEIQENKNQLSIESLIQESANKETVVVDENRRKSIKGRKSSNTNRKSLSMKEAGLFTRSEEEEELKPRESISRKSDKLSEDLTIEDTETRNATRGRKSSNAFRKSFGELGHSVVEEVIPDVSSSTGRKSKKGNHAKVVIEDPKTRKSITNPKSANNSRMSIDLSDTEKIEGSDSEINITEISIKSKPGREKSFKSRKSLNESGTSMPIENMDSVMVVETSDNEDCEIVDEIDLSDHSEVEKSIKTRQSKNLNSSSKETTGVKRKVHKKYSLPSVKFQGMEIARSILEIVNPLAEGFGEKFHKHRKSLTPPVEIIQETNKRKSIISDVSVKEIEDKEADNVRRLEDSLEITEVNELSHESNHEDDPQTHKSFIDKSVKSNELIKMSRFRESMLDQITARFSQRTSLNINKSVKFVDENESNRKATRKTISYSNKKVNESKPDNGEGRKSLKRKERNDNSSKEHESDSNVINLDTTRGSLTRQSSSTNDVNNLSNEIKADVSDLEQQLDNRKSVHFRTSNDLSNDNETEPSYSPRKSSRGRSSSINSKSVSMNESEILGRKSVETRMSSVRKSVVSEDIDLDDDSEVEEMSEENMEIEKSMNERQSRAIRDELSSEEIISEDVESRKSMRSRKSFNISRKSVEKKENSLIGSNESEEIDEQLVSRKSLDGRRSSNISGKSFDMTEDNKKARHSKSRKSIELLENSEGENAKARKSSYSRKSSEISRKSIGIKDNNDMIDEGENRLSVERKSLNNSRKSVSENSKKISRESLLDNRKSNSLPELSAKVGFIEEDFKCQESSKGRNSSNVSRKSFDVTEFGVPEQIKLTSKKSMSSRSSHMVGEIDAIHNSTVVSMGNETSIQTRKSNNSHRQSLKENQSKDEIAQISALVNNRKSINKRKSKSGYLSTSVIEETSELNLHPKNMTEEETFNVRNSISGSSLENVKLDNNLRSVEESTTLAVADFKESSINITFEDVQYIDQPKNIKDDDKGGARKSINCRKSDKLKDVRKNKKSRDCSAEIKMEIETYLQRMQDKIVSIAEADYQRYITRKGKRNNNGDKNEEPKAKRTLRNNSQENIVPEKVRKMVTRGKKNADALQVETFEVQPEKKPTSRRGKQVVDTVDVDKLSQEDKDIVEEQPVKKITTRNGKKDTKVTQDEKFKMPLSKTELEIEPQTVEKVQDIVEEKSNKRNVSRKRKQVEESVAVGNSSVGVEEQSVKKASRRKGKQIEKSGEDIDSKDDTVADEQPAKRLRERKVKQVPEIESKVIEEKSIRKPSDRRKKQVETIRNDDDEAHLTTSQSRAIRENKKAEEELAKITEDHLKENLNWRQQRNNKVTTKNSGEEKVDEDEPVVKVLRSKAKQNMVENESTTSGINDKEVFASSSGKTRTATRKVNVNADVVNNEETQEKPRTRGRHKNAVNVVLEISEPQITTVPLIGIGNTSSTEPKMSRGRRKNVAASKVNDNNDNVSMSSELVDTGSRYSTRNGKTKNQANELEAKENKENVKENEPNEKKEAVKNVKKRGKNKLLEENEQIDPVVPTKSLRRHVLNEKSNIEQQLEEVPTIQTRSRRGK